MGSVTGYKYYSISYELTRPKNTYGEFYSEVKKAVGWWHYLDTTWIIATQETARQIFDRLEPHLSKDDHILVVEVASNYYGYLKKEAWTWLSKNIG